MRKIIILILFGLITAIILLLELFLIKSILLSEISFVVIIYLIRLNGIYNDKSNDKLMEFIFATSWLVIFIFLAIGPQILTLESAKNTLITFAIIGTLLFGFFPQGINNINKNYKPNGKQIYDDNKLAKEVIDIMRSFLIFIFVCLLEILLNLFFSKQNQAYYIHLFLLKNNIIFSIIYFFSMINMAFISLGFGSFIYGLIKIFKIYRNL